MASAAISTINADIALVSKGELNMATTFVVETHDERVDLLSKILDSEPISSVLNTVIEVKDFVIQNVELSDEETGEITDAIRTTVVTGDGKTYHATSKGIVQSVKSMLGILGHPSTWTKPVFVKVVSEGKAPRAYYTIKPATAPSK